MFVLTGTASLFRAYALKAVADSRGSLIPGDPGQVYDTLAMTEDNEMTLALKSLGAKMVSPMQCRVITEVMPTWTALWRQRMRWQRGALENIGAYGVTRATLRYWLQQLGIGYGTIALNAYLLLLLITLLSADRLEIVWFWAAIGTIFIVERVVTVWAVGWRGRRSRSRCSSKSHMTWCSRPCTSSRSSKSPAAARPAGTTSPGRRSRAAMIILAGILLLQRRAANGMVPGARRLRCDQHPHLRRVGAREADSASACLNRYRTLVHGWFTTVAPG